MIPIWLENLSFKIVWPLQERLSYAISFGLTATLILSLTVFCLWTSPSGANSPITANEELDNPETIIRLLVKANEMKDLTTMEQYMGANMDAIGYSIGGRKYQGWNEFAQAMQEEFDSVERLKIPITELRVWQHGDVAWFAMELDYTREVVTQKGRSKTIIPLRETGVLERRNGKWMLVNWHESLQKPLLMAGQNRSTGSGSAASRNHTPTEGHSINLSGEWEIHEEDKSYQATLDTVGNGSYTWQEGKIVTTQVSDRLWSGTWSQKGNDREGEFEVLLSEDYSTADGVWWYTRVGNQSNIPPREWGGKYVFKRLTPVPRTTSGP